MSRMRWDSVCEATMFDVAAAMQSGVLPPGCGPPLSFSMQIRSPLVAVMDDLMRVVALSYLPWELMAE